MVIQNSSTAVPRADLGMALSEMWDDFTQFGGLSVFPVIRANMPKGSYMKITRESLARTADGQRAPSTKYSRENIGVKPADYECLEYGHEFPIDDGQRGFYAESFEADLVAVRHAFRRIMYGHDLRVASAVFNTTTFTGSALYTDNSSSPWATVTTNIIGQVIAAIEKVRGNTGMRPNALIVGASTLPSLLSNTGIVNRFPGAEIVSAEMLLSNLGRLFGLERLIVGGAVYNGATEGQDFSGTDVWSGNYAMVARVAPAGSDTLEPCLGRTALWVSDTPEAVTVEQYRDESIKSDVFRARQYVDEVLHDPYFGHLIKIKE